MVWAIDDRSAIDGLFDSGEYLAREISARDFDIIKNANIYLISKMFVFFIQLHRFYQDFTTHIPKKEYHFDNIQLPSLHKESHSLANAPNHKI